MVQENCSGKEVLIMNATKTKTAKNERGIKMAKGKKKVKAEAKTKASLVIHNPDLKPKSEETVSGVSQYTFAIKGTEKEEKALLSIGGKKDLYAKGQTLTLPLEKVDMPDLIKGIFTPVLKEGYPDSLQLSLKKGYHRNQMGLTRKLPSWKGYFSYTDGKLCCHTFESKGVGMEKIRELGKKHELTVDTSGANWVTWSVNKNNMEKCISFGKEYVGLLK
jgi:hypothetical protein